MLQLHNSRSYPLLCYKAASPHLSPNSSLSLIGIPASQSPPSSWAHPRSCAHHPSSRGHRVRDRGRGREDPPVGRRILAGRHFRTLGSVREGGRGTCLAR